MEIKCGIYYTRFTNPYIHQEVWNFTGCQYDPIFGAKQLFTSTPNLIQYLVYFTILGGYPGSINEYWTQMFYKIPISPITSTVNKVSPPFPLFSICRDCHEYSKITMQGRT